MSDVTLESTLTCPECGFVKMSDPPESAPVITKGRCDVPPLYRGAGDAWRAHHAFQRVGGLCRETKGLESLGVGIGEVAGGAADICFRPIAAPTFSVVKDPFSRHGACYRQKARR
jgi:hypothetical protein